MRRILILLSLSIALVSCETDSSVQIGVVLPLTGEFQVYGQSIQKGVELAFEELIADEQEYQYGLSVLDSESDPAKAKALSEQLYTDGAVAVIGGATTDEAMQSVSVAESFDRVLLSPSASTPELTGISKYFYRVFTSDAREGTTMSNFATQKLKVSSAVILAKESAYAKGIQEVFRTNFERQGGEILEQIDFPTGGDFSGLIDRVMTLEPGAVYLAAYAEDISEMILELRRRNYRGYILTTAAFAAPDIIERVGKPAEKVFLTQTGFDTSSEEPNIKGFVTAYREKYGLTPDLYAAHGYDALNVLAAAIQRSGVDFPSELWSSLRALREVNGVTGTLQFDERGDVQKFPRVFMISEGRLVDYDKEVERKRKEIMDRLNALERRRRSGGS